MPRYESLQPLYNLVEREPYESELEPVCREHGVGVINFYALASGFLTGKYRSAADLGKSVRGSGAGKYLNERGLAILGALDAVAGDGRRDAGAGRARLADRAAGHHRADRQRDQRRRSSPSSSTPRALTLDTPSIELIDRVSRPTAVMSAA